MRRLLSALLIAMALLAPSLALAQISTPTNILPDIFPINSGAASTGTTASTAANSLIFISTAATGASDSFSSYTDSSSNSYTTTTVTDGSNGAVGFAWKVLASSLASGATYTAVTSDASQWGIGEGWYVTGATGGLDTNNSVLNDQSNVGTSLSLSTGTLGVASEIIVGTFNTNGNMVTWTEASGFTTLHNDGFSITSYKIVSATASVTWNPSFTATGPFSAVLLSFKATPAGASCPPPSLALLGVGC